MISNVAKWLKGIFYSSLKGVFSKPIINVLADSTLNGISSIPK
jgi:hypothetical protein